jgi:endonuclease YncB( thermonuclease family)
MSRHPLARTLRRRLRFLARSARRRGALLGAPVVFGNLVALAGHAPGGAGPLMLRAERGAASGAAGGFTVCARASQPNCVIDGDTIRLAGVKIRLEDIDAPEVFSPHCSSELARGNRATLRLLALINQGPFELVRTGPRDRDRYGRMLRTLERAGRSLGGVLIAEGLARPWDGARHPWCG